MTADRADFRQTATSRRTVLKYAALAGASVGLATRTGLLARGAAAQEGTPVSGDTLNVGVAAELKVLDPHITTLAAYATTIRFTVFETLVEANDKGEYIPSLADSWEFGADGL
jgi:ABC-type transport system substrate-binding protein